MKNIIMYAAEGFFLLGTQERVIMKNIIMSAAEGFFFARDSRTSMR